MVDRRLVVVCALLTTSCGVANALFPDTFYAPLPLLNPEGVTCDPQEHVCCATDGSCSCDDDTCTCGEGHCALSRDADAGGACTGDSCTFSCALPDDCVIDHELCRYSLSACQDATEIYGACNAAGIFTQAAHDEGPLIEVFGDQDVASGAVESTWSFQFRYWDLEGDFPPAGAPVDVQFHIEGDADVQAAVVPSHTDGASAIASQDGFIDVEVTLPDVPARPVAFRTFDGAGHESNVFCLELDAP